MSNEKQFSIRLANGQEKTFDSAAEMAAWIAEQKANRRPVRKKSAGSRNRMKKRKVRCYSGDSPLT
jgi:hypothetical protein